MEGAWTEADAVVEGEAARRVECLRQMIMIGTRESIHLLLAYKTMTPSHITRYLDY